MENFPELKTFKNDGKMKINLKMINENLLKIFYWVLIVLFVLWVIYLLKGKW